MNIHHYEFDLAEARAKAQKRADQAKDLIQDALDALGIFEDDGDIVALEAAKRRLYRAQGALRDESSLRV